MKRLQFSRKNGVRLDIIPAGNDTPNPLHGMSILAKHANGYKFHILGLGEVSFTSLYRCATHFDGSMV